MTDINEKKKKIQEGLKIKRYGVSSAISRNCLTFTRIWIVNYLLSLVFPNIYLILVVIYALVEMGLIVIKTRKGPNELELAEKIMKELDYGLLKNYNFQGRDKEKVKKYLRYVISKITKCVPSDLENSINEYAKYCKDIPSHKLIFSINDKLVDEVYERYAEEPETTEAIAETPLVILRAEESGNVMELSNEDLQDSMSHFWSTMEVGVINENKLEDNSLENSSGEMVLRRTRNNSFYKKQ